MPWFIRKKSLSEILDIAANRLTVVLLLIVAVLLVRRNLISLRSGASARPDLKVVAVMPQAIEVAKQYVDRLGAHVNEIRQASLKQTGPECAGQIHPNEHGRVVGIYQDRNPLKKRAGQPRRSYAFGGSGVADGGSGVAFIGPIEYQPSWLSSTPLCGA
jgi:hypothetical protein